MIEVELSSQLCRSNGLSDPDSQVVVSGEAVDWLQSGMPGLMRGQDHHYHCPVPIVSSLYLIVARQAVPPQNPNQR